MNELLERLAHAGSNGEASAEELIAGASDDEIKRLRAVLFVALASGRLDSVPGWIPDSKPDSAYVVPGPYDIAMAFGAAALASGNYSGPGPAMAAAWMAVPEFYLARDLYVRDMAVLQAQLWPSQTPQEANANANTGI